MKWCRLTVSSVKVSVHGTCVCFVCAGSHVRRLMHVRQGPSVLDRAVHLICASNRVAGYYKRAAHARVRMCVVSLRAGGCARRCGVRYICAPNDDPVPAQNCCCRLVGSGVCFKPAACVRASITGLRACDAYLANHAITCTCKCIPVLLVGRSRAFCC